MIEIKFRAKRQDRDEWVYGDLTHVQKMCKAEEVERTGKRSMPAVRVGNYDVDESTIGQYTGCDDSQGTPIWEGDVLEFIDTDGYRHLKTVVFDKGAFCFKHAENNGLTPLKSHQWWKYTVAGNIYDRIN